MKPGFGPAIIGPRPLAPQHSTPAVGLAPARWQAGSAGRRRGRSRAFRRVLLAGRLRRRGCAVEVIDASGCGHAPGGWRGGCVAGDVRTRIRGRGDRRWRCMRCGRRGPLSSRRGRRVRHRRSDLASLRPRGLVGPAARRQARRGERRRKNYDTNHCFRLLSVIRAERGPSEAGSYGPVPAPSEARRPNRRLGAAEQMPRPPQPTAGRGASHGPRRC